MTFRSVLTQFSDFCLFVGLMEVWGGGSASQPEVRTTSDENVVTDAAERTIRKESGTNHKARLEEERLWLKTLERLELRCSDRYCNWISCLLPSSQIRVKMPPSPTRHF